MTPAGYAQLDAEFNHLWKVERPKLVETISWAASNGDRSENGDYIYGKKRLREIDRRIRFLSKRLDNAEVVDPAGREEGAQVFFGAPVPEGIARCNGNPLRGAGLELIGAFPSDRLVEEINQFTGVAFRLAGCIVVACQDQQTYL